MSVPMLAVELVGSDRVHRIPADPRMNFAQILRRIGLQPGRYEALTPDRDRLIRLDESPIALGVRNRLEISATMRLGARFRRNGPFDDESNGRNGFAIVAPFQAIRRQIEAAARRMLTRRGNNHQQPVFRPQPRKRSLMSWMIRHGWTPDGERLFGTFRTSRGQWPGRIERRDGHYDVYIQDPPKFMLTGPDSACIQPADGNWYRLHQHTKSGWLIGTVRAVEILIVKQALLSERGRIY